MNVYDFDGTIYKGDCSVDFFVYCLKNNKIRLVSLVKALFSAARYICGNISTKQFKEVFFSFVTQESDEEINTIVNDFWDCHKQNIQKWYYDKHDESDVIISATPFFILFPIKEILKIEKVIANVYDCKNAGNVIFVGFDVCKKIAPRKSICKI